jgi:hypothetical protein
MAPGWCRTGNRKTRNRHDIAYFEKPEIKQRWGGASIIGGQDDEKTCRHFDSVNRPEWFAPCPKA